MAVFTIPPDLALTVSDRLVAAGADGPERYAALAILCAIVGTMAPQSYSTRRKMDELAELLAMDRDTFRRGLRWLANVQAVQLTQHRGNKRLGVVPPGARLPGRPRDYPPESRTAESV